MDKNVVWGDYASVESFDVCTIACYGCWGPYALFMGL